MNHFTEKQLEEADIRLTEIRDAKVEMDLSDTPRTETDIDNMPMDAALEFADRQMSTGGLMTFAALKTLAAGCRELTAARAEIDMMGIRYAAAEMHHANNMQEVTEQRDRLAKALNTVVEVARRNLHSPHPTIERIYSEAIQSLTTNATVEARRGVPPNPSDV
jgi:hypothetical protein